EPGTSGDEHPHVFPPVTPAGRSKPSKRRGKRNNAATLRRLGQALHTAISTVKGGSHLGGATGDRLAGDSGRARLSPTASSAEETPQYAGRRGLACRWTGYGHVGEAGRQDDRRPAVGGRAGAV